MLLAAAAGHVYATMLPPLIRRYAEDCQRRALPSTGHIAIID
jgi:hypothetical protein